MGHIHQHDVQLLYNDARFASLFQALDELHTAASEDDLEVMTTLSKAELLGWLRDFVYTAQETITEIENKSGNYPVSLRLVK